MSKIAKLHALSILAMAGAGAMGKSGAHFALDYGDIGQHDPTKVNAPGTDIDIFFARRAEFLVLQDVGTPTTIGDLGVVATAHTFTSPAGFHSLRVHVDQNSVKNELMGNGAGSKNSARIFIKGNLEEVRGLAQQMNNDDCIFLIPLKSGEIAQIGSKKCQATVTAAFDSLTDASTDPRGWAFDIVCYDKYATYYDPTLAITMHS